MLRTALILSLAFGVATPGLARETQASAAAKFKREFAASDINKDGVLTLDEVQARTERMKVGPGQPDQLHARRLAQLWFTNADRNKDGKVTEAEAQALLAAMFKRYDASRDGTIEGTERATAKRELGKR